MKKNLYEDPSILFQIKRSDYFIRYFFLAWIAFAVYQFEVNPVFFSVTIAFAVLCVVGISDKIINLKSDRIEIKSKRWFPVFSSEETLLISEIKSVDHYISDPGAVLTVLSALDGVAGIARRTDKIFIEFKDSRNIYEIRFGTLKEKRMLTELIQKRIQTFPKH
jgi:hypothetical protein